MLLGDDHEAQGCKAKIFARGVIMEEGGDATWLSPIVTALRGLFQNGESRPRVAIVVAVGDGPGIATTVPTPDPAVLVEEAVGAEGADSDGSVPWDEVPVATVEVAHHADGWSSRALPAVNDDYCRRCGSGIIHRPGDLPRFWHTQWGKRYHVGHECYGLRTAHRKFPLHCLADKPHLTPCKLCV